VLSGTNLCPYVLVHPADLIGKNPSDIRQAGFNDDALRKIGAEHSLGIRPGLRCGAEIETLVVNVQDGSQGCWPCVLAQT